MQIASVQSCEQCILLSFFLSFRVLFVDMSLTAVAASSWSSVPRFQKTTFFPSSFSILLLPAHTCSYRWVIITCSTTHTWIYILLPGLGAVCLSVCLSWGLLCSYVFVSAQNNSFFKLFFPPSLFPFFNLLLASWLASLLQSPFLHFYVDHVRI